MYRNVVSLPFVHMMKCVDAAPIKKIRILLEGTFNKVKDRSDELFQKLKELYMVAISLDDLSFRDGVFVPWVFPQTKENYERFIKPWLMSFPDIKYRSNLERDMKLAKLQGKEEWERFFMVTSQMGISEVSLEEMRRQFAVYAMPEIMKATDIAIGMDMKHGFMLLPIKDMDKENEEL